MIAWHFVLRAVRHGPLLPAKLWFCDHAPDDPPGNRLDRGRLSLFPRVDIGGTETDPDILLDRLGFRRRGDAGSLPYEVLATLADPKRLTPRPVGHWAYAQPISEAEYKWRLDSLRWLESNQPNHPVLRPRQRVVPADMDVPNFTRERELLD